MKRIKSLLIICLCLAATSGIYAQGLFQNSSQETTPGNVEGNSSSFFSSSEEASDFSLRSDEPVKPPKPGEEDYVGAAPIGDGLWIVVIGIVCYTGFLIRKKKQSRDAMIASKD